MDIKQHKILFIVILVIILPILSALIFDSLQLYIDGVKIRILISLILSVLVDLSLYHMLIIYEYD